MAIPPAAPTPAQQPAPLPVQARNAPTTPNQALPDAPHTAAPPPAIAAPTQFPTEPVHATGTPPAATPDPAAALAAIAAAPSGRTAAPAIAPARAQPAPTAPQATAPQPPAAQLGAALVGLASAAGSHRLSLALAPVELGHVHIDLVRAADGTATLTITAERAETLAQLRGSTAALAHALDQAGIAAAGRSVSFNLASDLATPQTAPGQTPAQADPGQGGQTPHQAFRAAPSNPDGADDDAHPDAPPTPLLLHGVIDLTA